MKANRPILRAAFGVLVTAGLLISHSQTGKAQLGTWSRIALDGGGVAEDVQELRRTDDNSLGDSVWSACMDGGLYRASYSSGWGEWKEYMAARGTLGVDAIKVGTTEYVIAGGQRTGVWYKEAPDAPGAWVRPPSGYPTNWRDVQIEDVAFHVPSSGSPSPTTQFFAILSEPVGVNSKNPGIYRWDATLQTPAFVRVDATYSYDDGRSFAKFYREIDSGHKDYLYATSRSGEWNGSPYDGGLFKFTGNYTGTGATFAEVSIVESLTTYDIKDVYGFSQWDDGSNIYSYVLADWTSNGSPTSGTSVFVATDLANTPSYAKLGSYGSYFSEQTADWVQYEEDNLGGVVGKPDGSGYHYFWIGTPSKYGVVFDHPNPTSAITEINGTTSPNTPPAPSLTK